LLDRAIRQDLCMGLDSLIATLDDWLLRRRCTLWSCIREASLYCLG
jgi:hypothetical protein